MGLDRERNLTATSNRTIVWLVAILFFSAIAGAIVAPPVYSLLVRFGRHVGWLSALRDLEFERVWSRSIMLWAIALGLATMKWSGLNGVAAFGYAARRQGVQSLLAGAFAGVLSMAFLQAFGFIFRAYEFTEGASQLLKQSLFGATLGALVVGLIEEGFFRGLLMRLFSGGRRFWTGALASSVLFSLAHFLKPEPPVAIAHADWRTGFELFGYVFNRLDGSWNSLPLALNLFLMGWALCGFAWVRGDVYFVAGLHAGWVWVLQALSGLVKRNADRGLIAFGPTADIAKGWLATAVLLMLAVVATRRAMGRGRGD